ncbi:MAG: lipid II flippase MurJ [Patescibacteria group bacterium]
MVGKVLSAMSKEIRGLHEAAYLLAIFTFVGQILSLVRDRTFAHFFGAGELLDAYFAAFRIPDLTFAFLTLFVSSFALIPLLEKRGGVQSSDTARLFGSIFAVFGVVSIFASTILYFVLPVLVPVIFPVFASSTQAVVVELSRVMLLQPVLLGLSLIVGSIVQATRKFFIYAIAPVVYNLGIIFGIVVLFPKFGTVGLAWGVVIGALLHLCIQLIPLVYTGNFVVPRVSRQWLQDIREVVILSLPRSLAVGVHQIVLFSFAVVGALSVAGSASVLMFGFNLQSVPLSIIGVSYASALFPSLAALYAKGDRELFAKEVWAAVRHLCLWIFLAVSLMIVLRAHIVRVILGTGAFTWSDTRLTAAVLAGFVISLVAQSLILIFSRAYYAAGRQRTPIAINVGAALFASVLSYGAFLWARGEHVLRFFVEDLFRVGGIPGTEVVFVALAYSLVMLVAAVIFALLYARDFGFEKRVTKSLLFSFYASVTAGAATYATLQIFGPLLPTDTFLGIFTQGALSGLVGVFVWGGTLLLVRSQELKEVINVVRRLLTA